MNQQEQENGPKRKRQTPQEVAGQLFDTISSETGGQGQCLFGDVVAAFMAGIDDDIVVVASGGTTIRTPVKEISSQGRAATGVRIMSMDDGQVVASAALVLSHDET